MSLYRSFRDSLVGGSPSRKKDLVKIFKILYKGFWRLGQATCSRVIGVTENTCFANVGLKIKQFFKTFHFPSHHVFLLMICFGCWPFVTKRTCIKGGFHDVYALFHIVVHSVHARCLIKCLLAIFSLVQTPMSTKLWGFSCFLIRNMFGPLVVYFTHLVSHVHFPCFGHALHKATSRTHLCYPCHALVVTLFLHPNMSCLPYALQHCVLYQV